jgi:predicted cobalt transporter CbtA
MNARVKSTGAGTVGAERTRPDHFSTYVPRGLVRRLKVVATIRDIPLWVLVTDALEEYLADFQKKYGQLPTLDDGRMREGE